MPNENHIDDALASRATRARKLRWRIARLEDEKKVLSENIKMLKAELDVVIIDLDDLSSRRDAGEQMMLPETELSEQQSLF